MTKRTLVMLSILSLSACSRARTEIMLRISTDMTQGSGAQLAAIRISVFGEGNTQPTYAATVPLGADGATLPSTLGLVPNGSRNALVTVKIDALDDDEATLFTKTVAARYVSGRTQLLDVFLAARCRDSAAQVCPSGESCGPLGCEKNLRENLPDFDGETPSDDFATPADLATLPGDMAGVDMSIEPDMSVALDMSASSDMTVSPDMTGIDLSMRDMSIPADMTIRDFAIPPDLTPVDLTEPDADFDAGDPGIPAPRPIEPASSGFTTSRRVRFRWLLLPPATAAHLEICTDRACTNVLQTQDVIGESTTALLPLSVGATHIYYFRLTGAVGAQAGRPHSPVWQFSVNGPVVSPPPSAKTGTWGSTHDFNGDGLSDVVGGAPLSSLEKVRLYKGRNPMNTAPSPDILISGDPPAKLGLAVLSGGDINGDGYPDLVVGSESNLIVFNGAAVISPSMTPANANGNPIALSAPASRATVAAAGDLDGDGYADLVVGETAQSRILLYSGGPGGIATVGTPFVRGEAGFGKSVAGACDVNADGYSDLIIGGDENATVMLGSSSGPGTVITLTPGPFTSPAPRAFGASVACAGDVNGDGYGDVIVGAPLDHAAFVYHGGASGTATTATGMLRKIPGEVNVGTKQGDHFGTVVASAGDINGDGYSDVVVAAPDPYPTPTSGFFGYVFAFWGSGTGVPQTPAGTNVSTNNTAHKTALGNSVGFEENRPQVSQYAGDLDADGYGEIVSGTPSRNSGAGGMLVGKGTSTGITSSAQWDLGSGLAGATFGASVAFLLPHPTSRAVCIQ